MAKSQETFNKKEREKKRRKKKQEKAERRAERKEQKKLEALEGKPKKDNFMYVDEDGNLTPIPPDPAKKRKINAEDIVLGIPKKGDIDPADLIRNGVVKFFNEEKGYGFIVDPNTNESFFVHVNNVTEPITDRDKVAFEIEMGPKGANAVNVKIIK